MKAFERDTSTCRRAGTCRRRACSPENTHSTPNVCCSPANRTNAPTTPAICPRWRHPLPQTVRGFIITRNMSFIIKAYCGAVVFAAIRFEKFPVRNECPRSCADTKCQAGLRTLQNRNTSMGGYFHPRCFRCAGLDCGRGAASAFGLRRSDRVSFPGSAANAFRLPGGAGLRRRRRGGRVRQRESLAVGNVPALGPFESKGGGRGRHRGDRTLQAHRRHHAAHPAPALPCHFAVGVAVGRIGLLFSQGIDDFTYGTPTALPWAHDFGDGVPRHPVQLYESARDGDLRGRLHMGGY